MKNTIKLIYFTIFSILFITVIFNIAELNLIAKTNYTNHLEQSLIMNGCYILLCKLIIQSVLTYAVGNMLYHKIKDDIMEKDLIKSMDKVSEERNNWKKYPDIMTKNRDDLSKIEDHFNNKEIVIDTDISTLQFDPIDQIDELDKKGLEPVYDRKGYIKDVKEIGIPLNEILDQVDITYASFWKEHKDSNKKWKKIEEPIELEDRYKDYRQYITIDDIDHWYELVE